MREVGNLVSVFFITMLLHLALSPQQHTFSHTISALWRERRDGEEKLLRDVVASVKTQGREKRKYCSVLAPATDLASTDELASEIAIICKLMKPARCCGSLA